LVGSTPFNATSRLKNAPRTTRDDARTIVSAVMKFRVPISSSSLKIPHAEPAGASVRPSISA